MKPFVMLAALALATPAWAQAQKPAAAAKPMAAQEAAKPVAREEAKPAMARKSRRHEDARHCLERASAPEIIRCAEEFL